MLRSLWNHAVSSYQRPGVAEACLTLQDRAGADVNLLLAGSWLAERGCRWQRDDVAALVQLSAGWRERCLLPLRQVRRYLKDHMDIADLYQSVKGLELEAERYQLHLIEEAIAHLRPQQDGLNPAERLTFNLRVCIELLPDEARTEAYEHLDPLLKALLEKSDKAP